MKFTSGQPSLVIKDKMADSAELLNNMLVEAANEGRFTCGVYECAQILETTPEEVEVCILPAVASNDISVLIQHKLIEAYCWENDIQVVRVDSADKLARLIKSGLGAVNNNVRVPSEPQDLSCVLVQFPAEHQDSLNQEDHQHPDVWPDTVICLPG